MSDIAIYIPVYNGADWCRSFEMPDGLNYVASDNCSTDGSPEILESRGIQVIRQPKSLGRLGNWTFCLEHFRHSKAEWMKFLFVGDRIAADCLESIISASYNYPQADVLLFGFDLVENGTSSSYFPSPVTKEFTAIHMLENSVKIGNWFGGLIGMVIRRRALTEPASFSTLDWCGDFYFAVTLASKCIIVGFPKTIGTFIAEHRNHNKKLKSTLQAFLEEMYVKNIAIQRLQELGYKGCESLRCDLARQLSLNAVSRLLGDKKQLDHSFAIAKLLPTSTLRKALFSRSIKWLHSAPQKLINGLSEFIL